MSRSSEPRKFVWPGGLWRSLGAIVAGNAIYYSIVNYLPAGAHHQPYAFDWGLAIDLWICVAAYGISCLIWPRNK
jgi:hypothetical protein